MPSPMIVSCECEPYLIRFLESYFETASPIEFPRNHDFNFQLTFLVTQPPKNWIEEDYGENNLRIQLPYMENKNAYSYWYLSRRAQTSFVERIRSFYKCVFHEQVNQSIILGFTRKESIEIFIERYNLPGESWDMMKKDYDRYRRNRRLLKLRKKRKISCQLNGSIVP